MEWIPVSLFILIICGPSLLITFEFLHFLIKGSRLKNKALILTVELTSVILFPAWMLLDEVNKKNDCCGDSAIFSPAHRLSIYVLIICCQLAFLYSRLRKRTAPPFLEVICNCLLMIAIPFNIIMAVHLGNNLSGTAIFLLIGNMPVVMAFVLALADNHRLFLREAGAQTRKASGYWEGLAWTILCLRPLQKWPVLLVLCLPVLAFIAGALLIFGQKPDSVIEAFTQTYKHGFSKLDYQCRGVVCGGHYLCTIAAKGHENFVRPLRYGKRHGSTIIVNRQLLVSNAFEELLQDRLPRLHRPVRKYYDRLGKDATRLYDVLGNPWISDWVYLLMKPLEWFFLLVLYCADRKPEDRIARQYTGEACFVKGDRSF